MRWLEGCGRGQGARWVVHNTQAGAAPLSPPPPHTHTHLLLVFVLGLRRLRAAAARHAAAAVHVHQHALPLVRARLLAGAHLLVLLLGGRCWLCCLRRRARRCSSWRRFVRAAVAATPTALAARRRRGAGVWGVVLGQRAPQQRLVVDAARAGGAPRLALGQGLAAVGGHWRWGAGGRRARREARVERRLLAACARSI